jgi:YidC/Oxa1 family membrane protein insertase
MPIFFAIIYISIPAGVNVYFIVSSLFRIGQQDAMYRWDPSLQASLERLRKNSSNLPTPVVSGAGGIRARFREAAGTRASSPAASNGTKSSSNGQTPKSPAFTPPRVQQTNRSKNKKQRRSR